MKRLLMLLLGPLLLLAACIPASPTPEPPGPPTPITRITREQAIQIALSSTGIMPAATAVENPRNPVARLMTLGEYQARFNLSSGPRDAAMLVWVVQFEGTSYSAGIGSAWPFTQYNYAVVVLDAESGNVIATTRLQQEPLFP